MPKPEEQKSRGQGVEISCCCNVAWKEDDVDISPFLSLCLLASSLQMHFLDLTSQFSTD